MTSEYTPTTYEMRGRAITGAALIVHRRDGVRISEAEEIAGVEFDRWLAEHDREVHAKALTDAAEDVEFRPFEWTRHGNPTMRANGEAEASTWLEARAAEIREGKD